MQKIYKYDEIILNFKWTAMITVSELFNTINMGNKILCKTTVTELRSPVYPLIYYSPKRDLDQRIDFV